MAQLPRPRGAVLGLLALSLGCGGGSDGKAGTPGDGSGGAGGAAVGGAGGTSPATGGRGGGGGASTGGTGGISTGGTGGAGGEGGADAAPTSPRDAGGADAGARDGAPPPPTGRDVSAACAAMVEAANKFLAALTPAQQTLAKKPFDDANRKDWNYLPPGGANARQGLALTGAQRAAADAFLRSGLSDGGFMKAAVIREIEARTQQGAYYVTIFGTPSATERWGWRFEGHHLSLNFTVVRCATIATTPAFFGVNYGPAQVQQMATLTGEQSLGGAMVMALDAQKRQAARLAEKPMNAAPPRTPTQAPPPAAGVLASELAPAELEALKRLVGEYLSNMTPSLAAVRLAEIQDAGFEKIRFSWAGAPNAVTYYRVHGPTFLIEYDYAGTNHIHSVWRDFASDFGVDVLRMHYQLFHR